MSAVEESYIEDIEVSTNSFISSSLNSILILSVQGGPTEIEVSSIMFERYLSILSMTSLKQQIEYFHFRCKIQLDLPVQCGPDNGSVGLFSKN